MSKSFKPIKRILMGPGPSDIDPRVLSSMSMPTIGHLDPLFIEFMESIKGLLRKTFMTDNKMTFPVSAPGSAGMEMCFANLIEPNDEVLICLNGVFGNRMVENASRFGAKVHTTSDEWGSAVDPQKVRDALKENPDIKVVAFVHAETSTGASSDAKLISSIAREYDALTIVDAVTSLGGSELRVDEWKLDAVYSGSQKCLSAPPGLSPITFSDKAIERVKARKTPCPSWFLDLSLLLNYWDGDGGRSYHHTAPINNLYALHEALVMLDEEGLENSWKRHKSNHELLKGELQGIGLDFVVPEAERLVQLNAVSIPIGANDAAIRSRLLNEFNLEIGAGLGALSGKVWRIGLMGASSTPEHVKVCSEALKSCLRH